MGTELLIQAIVVALGEEIDVLLAEDRAKAIGILLFPRLAAAMGIAEEIGLSRLQARHEAGEEALGTEGFQFGQNLAAGIGHGRPMGAGSIDAHDRPAFDGETAEDREGIAMDTPADLPGLMLVRPMVDRTRFRSVVRKAHFRTCLFSRRAMIPRKGIDSHAGRMAAS